MKQAIDIVVAIGWLVLIVYWFRSAAGLKKTSYSSWRRFALLRLSLFIIAVAIVRAVTTRNGSAGYLNLSINSLTVKIGGLVIFLAGLSLAVWARRTLGQNWGFPMDQKDQPELVMVGPYRYIRHPIYSAFILGFLGTALAVSLYWLGALLIGGIYFVYSSYQEEAYLTKQLPKEYKDYKRKTKRLIPYLY